MSRDNVEKSIMVATREAAKRKSKVIAKKGVVFLKTIGEPQNQTQYQHESSVLVVEREKCITKCLTVFHGGPGSESWESLINEINKMIEDFHFDKITIYGQKTSNTMQNEIIEKVASCFKHVAESVCLKMDLGTSPQVELIKQMKNGENFLQVSKLQTKRIDNRNSGANTFQCPTVDFHDQQEYFSRMKYYDCAFYDNLRQFLLKTKEEHLKNAVLGLLKADHDFYVEI